MIQRMVFVGHSMLTVVPVGMRQHIWLFFAVLNYLRLNHVLCKHGVHGVHLGLAQQRVVLVRKHKHGHVMVRVVAAVVLVANPKAALSVLCKHGAHGVHLGLAQQRVVWVRKHNHGHVMARVVAAVVLVANPKAALSVLAPLLNRHLCLFRCQLPSQRLLQHLRQHLRQHLYQHL
jgi:hypothetical protein